MIWLRIALWLNRGNNSLNLTAAMLLPILAVIIFMIEFYRL
jgi:hypothetical protein